MEKIPEQIYIVRDWTNGDTEWCVDKIHEDDIEYVPASKLEKCLDYVEELKEQVRRLNEAIDDAPIVYGYDN